MRKIYPTFITVIFLALFAAMIAKYSDAKRDHAGASIPKSNALTTMIH